MNRRPRLRIYTAIPCVYSGLSEQLQLFGSNAFGALLPRTVTPSLRERTFDKRQRNMIGPIVMYEGCVSCPIHARDRSGGQSGVERKCLVDQSKPVSSLYHPPHVSRCIRGARQMHWNPDLREHLNQPGMRGWLEFGITEDLDAIRYLMNIEL